MNKAANKAEDIALEFQDLKKVTRRFDSTEKRIMEIEDDSGVPDLQPRTALPSRSGKSTMFGLDEELIEILNWLDGKSLARDILSICGMAGIGKTTFARKIYDDQRVQEIFHVRAWATVSQNYDERKILLDLLDSMKQLSGQMHNLETSDLKDKLHKNLKRQRYLIVIDDIWDTKVWNDVDLLFPKDQVKSRIILTTRLEKVAVDVNSSRSALHRMRFLNDDESWNLFCEKVFGGNCCPGELNQTGTEIVKKCGGLPLAIVLIGGLLSNSTRSYWDYVAKNLSSVITSHDDQSSKILHLSYNNLPHHLRVCFLYMGVFPEDNEILASKLVKLWIAEGFIEPETSKSLEDVAEEYLLNLVERSLILLSKRSSEGKIKTCKIHDLLREFCVREAKKESFFHVTDRSLRDLPTEINTSHVTDTNFQSLPANFFSLRRVSIHPNTQTNFGHAYNLPTSTVRSVLNFDPTLSTSVEFLNSSLLRVLDTVNGNSSDFPTVTVKLPNLRYLACLNGVRELPSPIYELRNLQTLILTCTEPPFRQPLEIWRMPQLRHVHLNSVNLPDPPIAGVEAENSLIVLQDLQSLSTVMNFKFVEDILRRIPNLKKLGILYDVVWVDLSDYYLNNLVLLQNLEAFKCLFHFRCQTFLQKIIFPPSLKKLTLRGCFLPWEDMGKVGLLPELQVLKLKRKAFSGPVWKPNDGQFRKLKFLLLEENNLEKWEAERIHFPNLEHLILDNCQRLIEVPRGIGEIETLQKIELYYCNDSLVASAKDIYEEQYDLGYENFKVRNVEIK